MYLKFSDVSDGVERKVAVMVKNYYICCKETQKTESINALARWDGFLQAGVGSLLTETFQNKRGNRLSRMWEVDEEY